MNLRMYEGLFLIDNAYASTEWENVVKHIQDVLQKNGSEILKTYKIKGHKRGTYFLVHFNANNSAITTIRRDFQLSDYVVRSLIVRDDKIEELSQIGLSEVPVEKDTSKMPEIADTVLSESSDVSVKVADKV